MTAEEAGIYLNAGGWRERFDAGALAHGLKTARARQVEAVRATFLDTGDLEITARVASREGAEFAVTLALWSEPDHSVDVEATCSCRSLQCEHAVATLAYLAKGKPGQRLAAALGQAPHAKSMTQGQTLQLGESASAAVESDRAERSSAGEAVGPRFLLRVERRAPDGPVGGLPEVYAHAHACYGDRQVPLEPSGILPPLVTPSGKIRRDRSAEMEALQTLYALDLLPADPTSPPTGPDRATAPNFAQRVWAADKTAWPHLEFYWQRFQHEATPALERRGWEVQFSAQVGLKPLVFRTDTWRAEIVEEGRGWFTLSAGFEIDGESFDLQPILAALVANRFLEATAGRPKGQEFLIFLPDGRGLALPVGRFRKILKTLGELTAFQFTEGPVRLSKIDAARLADEAALEPETPGSVAELGVQLRDFHKIPLVPEPRGLEATLRDYQREGFHWMQFLARHAINGILADDMGLGKTLQTLTHILAETQSGRSQGRPTLVLAPTSVVENWQREASRFAPALRVLLLQGSDRHRRFPGIPAHDLVLSSYALFPRDLEHFLPHVFHLCVLDEAQHIKNPQARISRAVCRVNAAHRLCLSGTPVENNLGEIWSLMHFLMPNLLGSQEHFNEVFRTPIERHGNTGKRDSLAARVGPLILRRSKHAVAKELPAKTEILHRIALSEPQKDLYETVRATMDKHVRRALELQGQQSQIVFLDALLKLRQICCHPRLLAGQSEAVPSSKFAYLIDLLDTLRQEKHRTLIFSQFTSLLALVEEHLETVACPYLKLTGESKNRQELVERFQGGEAEVFLISLKAGGTGLTLTGADTVIHYDPWWNPAAENQATDRAHRIGQDKPVFVHKLICSGSVEERIQQMQTRKHALASDLLSGATHQLSLTAETLESLLAPLPMAAP